MIAGTADGKVIDTEREDARTIKSFGLNMFAPFIAAALMVFLALQLHWKTNLTQERAILYLCLTMAGSTYALAQGYSQIWRHGLKAMGIFLWYVATIVSVLLAADIAIYGSAYLSTEIVFPGSRLLASPIIFLALIAFQAFYFLSSAFWVVISNARGHRTGDWYAGLYFLILSINTAAITLVPIIIKYL